MNCKLCQSVSNKIFSGKILNKYEIDYFQCQHCSFIQAEEAFWLEESYSSVIAITDVGLVSRNLSFQNISFWIIKKYFDYKGKFIDFAGGYGLFVRLMRDKGLNFFRQDLYCENIFAQYFDVTNQTCKEKFEVLTAFEVFEHLSNPIEEIEKMFEYSNNILFSTELQPRTKMQSVNDWRYFALETGQHISFYNIKSLEIIAEKFNCYFYSNAANLHILTKYELPTNPFEEWEKFNKKTFLVKILYKLIRYIENMMGKEKKEFYLESLRDKDYYAVIEKIKEM
ncbi:hypothetical protein B6A10_15420 [Flavobacterium sp. L1I52]|uniref:Methyltransferase domain-containing protein n=1 Tax=Flavobacterium pokkalii TaxID=1940408 RepID=A0ABR7UWC1_9FLAO|nr:class I SAM-dependent methyltransferase [Flavobacterium pokkalii]MBD0726562.1 hypothetical protein [Flavobacterium pokkalii]